jgi:hypothetical protein
MLMTIKKLWAKITAKVLNSENSKNRTTNNSSGVNSNDMRAKGDIVINNGGMVLYSIEEVAKQLVNSVFGELSQETKALIAINQQSYFQILREEIVGIKKQGDELKKTVDSPDFQYISKQAAISASRSSSAELHKNLASLLIHRINHDQEDLKKIMYDEAITVTPKITLDQLKIATLCFVIKHTKKNGITTPALFHQFLINAIKPLVDFKNTNIQFAHLVYTGCVTLTVSHHNLVDIFKRHYGNIFKDDESLKTLLLNDETAIKLLSVWQETPIKRMELTSIGIAIASSYLEQITKDKIDIDCLIN